MTRVRDRLWIWGHEAGSHNWYRGIKDRNLKSRMTPAEGAFYLGVPNIIMVRHPDAEGNLLPRPPFNQHALALSPLKKVVWSIVGAGGGFQTDELDQVLGLTQAFPNICGVQMDDFFFAKPDLSERIAPYSPGALKTLKQRLLLDGRKLELWVTVYTSNLDLPNVEATLRECDMLTFWTWHARDILNLQRNFDRLERKAPSSRIALGCYMWDYGECNPMPVDLMQRQCELGLDWLRSGRIEGMVFLASCIADLGLEAVEWSRSWIRQVGEETI